MKLLAIEQLEKRYLAAELLAWMEISIAEEEVRVDVKVSALTDFVRRDGTSKKSEAFAVFHDLYFSNLKLIESRVADEFKGVGAFGSVQPNKINDFGGGQLFELALGYNNGRPAFEEQLVATHIFEIISEEDIIFLGLDFDPDDPFFDTLVRGHVGPAEVEVKDPVLIIAPEVQAQTDVNNDGLTNMRDVLGVVEAANNIENTFEGDQPDVNSDGIVDIKDVNLVVADLLKE